MATVRNQPINQRQQAFATAYVAYQNATRAASAAGYKGNPATLAITGHKLLKLSKVQDAIEAAKARLPTNQSLPTDDDIIRGLAREAAGLGPDTTSASRVTAWRTLAEIRGMNARSGDLPTALVTLLAGVKAAVVGEPATPRAIEAESRVVSDAG